MPRDVARGCCPLRPRAGACHARANMAAAWAIGARLAISTFCDRENRGERGRRPADRYDFAALAAGNVINGEQSPQITTRTRDGTFLASVYLRRRLRHRRCRRTFSRAFFGELRTNESVDGAVARLHRTRRLLFPVVLSLIGNVIEKL